MKHALLTVLSLLFLAPALMAGQGLPNNFLVEVPAPGGTPDPDNDGLWISRSGEILDDASEDPYGLVVGTSGSNYQVAVQEIGSGSWEAKYETSHGITSNTINLILGPTGKLMAQPEFGLHRRVATLESFTGGQLFVVPVDCSYGFPDVASTMSAGLMSSADKAKLNSLVVIQRTRAQTDAAGALTWTFGTAFGTGVTPVISLTVEDATASTVWNHRITAISNTSVTIQLDKATITNLLGVNLLSVAASPQAFVHLTAVAP